MKIVLVALLIALPPFCDVRYVLKGARNDGWYSVDLMAPKTSPHLCLVVLP